MAKKIKDKIIKSEKIAWKKVKSLQPEDAKILYNLDALVELIKEHGISKASDVWQDPKTKDIYWVDGHTRKKAFEILIKQGFIIPSKIQANFVSAKNKKEAIKILLEVHNLKHNPVNEEVLYKWLEVEEVSVEEIKVEVLSYDNVSFASQFGNTEEGEAPKTKSGNGEPELKPKGDKIQASHVRMLQLFLSTETEPLFRQYEQQVRVLFDSDNLTDTIYGAMKWVSENKGLIKPDGKS